MHGRSGAETWDRVAASPAAVTAGFAVALPTCRHRSDHLQRTAKTSIDRLDPKRHLSQTPRSPHTPVAIRAAEMIAQRAVAGAGNYQATARVHGPGQPSGCGTLARQWRAAQARAARARRAPLLRRCVNAVRALPRRCVAPGIEAAGVRPDGAKGPDRADCGGEPRLRAATWGVNGKGGLSGMLAFPGLVLLRWLQMQRVMMLSCSRWQEGMATACRMGRCNRCTPRRGAACGQPWCSRIASRA